MHRSFFVNSQHIIWLCVLDIGEYRVYHNCFPRVVLFHSGLRVWFILYFRWNNLFLACLAWFSGSVLWDSYYQTILVDSYLLLSGWCVVCITHMIVRERCAHSSEQNLVMKPDRCGRSTSIFSEIKRLVGDEQILSYFSMVFYSDTWIINLIRYAASSIDISFFVCGKIEKQQKSTLHQNLWVKQQNCSNTVLFDCGNWWTVGNV